MPLPLKPSERVVCNVYCLRFILNDHKSLCMNGSASYAIMCCRIYLGDYLGQLVKVRTVRYITDYLLPSPASRKMQIQKQKPKMFHDGRIETNLPTKVPTYLSHVNSPV